MRRMVEGSYIIMEANYYNKLRDKVNAKTKVGYEVVGGINSALHNRIWYFYQAMCKYEDIETNVLK